MSNRSSDKLLVETICDHINKHDVKCIYGENAFEDFIPEELDNCISILEYAGTPHRQEPVELRSFQINVKNKSNGKAKELCREIYKVLDNKEKLNVLSNGRWCIFYIRSTPTKLKVDEKGRHIYIFNIGVTAPIE